MHFLFFLQIKMVDSMKRQDVLVAFSFDVVGAKEKACKKKSAKREISPRARGEEGSAPSTCANF